MYNSISQDRFYDIFFLYQLFEVMDKKFAMIVHLSFTNDRTFEFIKKYKSKLEYHYQLIIASNFYTSMAFLSFTISIKDENFQMNN